METDNSHQSIAERLKKKVQDLAGVPSRLVPLLHRLGLRTARDVLFFFPRDYEDLTRICAIREIDGSGPVSVCGVVDEAESRTLTGGRSVLGVLIRDDSGTLRASGSISRSCNSGWCVDNA